VNGLIAQFMNRVTPMPRQCSATCPSAAKSTFISIGMIISQISTATGRLTLAISAEPTAPASSCRARDRYRPVLQRSAGIMEPISRSRSSTENGLVRRGTSSGLSTIELVSA
jgi:hypothetical protein